MRAAIYQIAILILMSITSTSCTGSVRESNCQNNMSLSTDSLKISQKTFDEKLLSYYDLMKESKDIGVDTMIDICRVYNTLGFEGLESKETSLYKDFSKLFFDEYMDRAVKMLEATLSRGMGYYSKKYNIDIGGTPRPGSAYTITD